MPKGFLTDVFQYIYDSDLIEARVVDQHSSETDGYLDSISETEYEEQIEVSRLEEECQLTDRLRPNEETRDFLHVRSPRTADRLLHQ